MDAKTDKTDRRKSLSDAAEDPNPTDGWKAIVVAFSASMLQALTFGVSNSFSTFSRPMQNDDSLGRPSLTAITLPSSVSTGLGPLITISAGLVMSRFGTRVTSIVSATSLGLALLVSSFAATSIATLVATYGLLMAVAVAFMIAPGATATSTWFVKRKALGMGICFTGGGTGSVIIPRIAGALAERYDWRTSFLILSTLSSISIFAGLFVCMRPEKKPQPPREKTIVEDSKAHGDPAKATNGPTDVSAKTAVAAAPSSPALRSGSNGRGPTSNRNAIYSVHRASTDEVVGEDPREPSFVDPASPVKSTGSEDVVYMINGSSLRSDGPVGVILSEDLLREKLRAANQQKKRTSVAGRADRGREASTTSDAASPLGGSVILHKTAAPTAREPADDADEAARSDAMPSTPAHPATAAANPASLGSEGCGDVSTTAAETEQLVPADGLPFSVFRDKGSLSDLVRHVYKTRNFAGLFFSYMFFSIGFFGMLFVSVPYVLAMGSDTPPAYRTAAKVSIADATTIFIPFGVMEIIGGPLLGYIASRTDDRIVSIGSLGLLAVTTGFRSLCRELWEHMLAMGLVGLGASGFFATYSSMIGQRFFGPNLPMIMSSAFAAAAVGGFSGAPIATSITAYNSGDYTYTMMFIASFFAASGFSVLFLVGDAPYIVPAEDEVYDDTASEEMHGADTATELTPLSLGPRKGPGGVAMCSVAIQAAMSDGFITPILSAVTTPMRRVGSLQGGAVHRQGSLSRNDLARNELQQIPHEHVMALDLSEHGSFRESVTHVVAKRTYAPVNYGRPVLVRTASRESAAAGSPYRHSTPPMAPRGGGAAPPSGFIDIATSVGARRVDSNSELGSPFAMRRGNSFLDQQQRYQGRGSGGLSGLPPRVGTPPMAPEASLRSDCSSLQFSV